MVNNNNPNLYLNIYKNLEKEVLKLADNIHFDDNQLNVYSLHIADLIIRCVIEIESISKELYQNEGGEMHPKDNNDNERDLYFDTDCINLLEEKWLLSKKRVDISTPLFYFAAKENKSLYPLANANKRGKCYWKKAYQSIKHNRMSAIGKTKYGNKTIQPQGTLKNLIGALAALYILNLYFDNKEFSVKSDKEILEFDKGINSQIFAIEIDYTYKTITQLNEIAGKDISECVYVATFNDNQINSIRETIRETNREKTIEYNKMAIDIVKRDIPERDLDFLYDKTNINIHGLGTSVGKAIITKEIANFQTDEKKIEYIKNHEFYKEYVKINKHNVKEHNTLDGILQQASIGYYYKKLVKIASEAGSLLPHTLFNTPSKLVLNKLPKEIQMP